VKSFGEFEFWFAGIKVVAIVAFIVIAVGYLFGIGGGDSPGLSNLTSHDGFAPAGIVTILSGVVIVIFAFVGAEIVTIAAAESGEPEQNVTRAVNQVVARVLTVYVAAIFLIVCVVPWSDVKSGESPFIAALEKIGIPGAADVMNAVVGDRGALVPELRHVHRLADAVRARPPRRRARGPARGQPPRRAGQGDPAHLVDRLRIDDHLLLVAGHRLPVPGQLVGRDRAVRLPADRGLRAADAAHARARGAGAAEGADVVLPVA
jgi:hypothetical protein